MQLANKTIIKAVTPVIHSVTKTQVKRNIRKCIKAGADGVWLIGAMCGGEEAKNFFAELRDAFPDLWIGINPLTYYPHNILVDLGPLAYSLNGIWTDNAEIVESALYDDQVNAIENKQFLESLEFKGQYFGGVAFKYQTPVKNLELVTRASIPFMDVITTSGAGTGIAADVGKIAMMHGYIAGEKPMGIASGVTPENVSDYLPYIDCFLVATGISLSYEELDETKMSKLIETVKAYKP